MSFIEQPTVPYTGQVHNASSGMMISITGASGMEAKELLERVDGVTGVEFVEGGTYQVSCAHGRDTRAELARAVIDRGWELLELRTVSMSLEEIFLKLTEGVALEELAEGSSMEGNEEGKDA